MAGTNRVIGTFGHRFLVVPDSRSLERTALLGFMTLSSKGDGKPPTQSGGCDSSVPSPRFPVGTWVASGRRRSGVHGPGRRAGR